MGRIKKFAAISIRKIAGGKDPIRLIEEFLVRHGFDPDECARERDAERARWMVAISDGEELEILLENLKVAHETTIYMGVNIATVPIRGSAEVLAAALEIADGLVGIKVSLVGHYLVLSATLGAAASSVDDLDFHYKLMVEQQPWFREALADELGWDELPGE